MTRVCRNRVGRGCGERKPVEAFYANKRKPGGLESLCRECMKADERERYWRNPEAQRKRLRQRYGEQPEHFAALQRARYAAERERERRAS